MDKLDPKLIKELEIIAEKFATDEYILDQRIIENNTHLRTGAFEYKFIHALTEFRRALPTDDYSYNSKCEKFHDVVIKAKACNAIINKPSLVESDDYKQRIQILENKLKEAESKIELLIEEKGVLKGKIEMYERDLPKSDTMIGDVD